MKLTLTKISRFCDLSKLSYPTSDSHIYIIIILSSCCDYHIPYSVSTIPSRQRIINLPKNKNNKTKILAKPNNDSNKQQFYQKKFKSKLVHNQHGELLSESPISNLYLSSCPLFEFNQNCPSNALKCVKQLQSIQINLDIFNSPFHSVPTIAIMAKNKKTIKKGLTQANYNSIFIN